MPPVRHFPPLGFVLLAALYIGAYYAMVDRIVFPSEGRWGARYPFGDEALTSFFAPIHRLDRDNLRPGYWRGEN
jgi:hypothetical protein